MRRDDQVPDLGPILETDVGPAPPQSVENATEEIPGSILIPLGQVAARIHELDAEKLNVVYCRVGARSAKACEILRANGFPNVINLRGGMVEWVKS